MKKLILIIVIIFTYSNMNAAQRIVSGQVFLENKYTLGNIVVTAKKSKATVSTNNAGEFSIACEKNDVLTFSAAPFHFVKKSVRKKDFITVKMTFKKGEIDEKNIVDLGFMKVEDFQSFKKTSKIKGKDFSDYVNIYDVIARELPHVALTTQGFVVRGKSSFQRSNAALLVVNGIQIVDISYINPANVISVDLLTASGAALYGSRGANGVIIIKTK